MKTANKLTFLSTKFFTENKREYRITVTISLDDDCHNNMCEAYNGILMNYWDVYDCMDEVEEPTDDDWLNAVSNLFDSYTYDVKNTDVNKFKMSDVMNVYRIINL